MVRTRVDGHKFEDEFRRAFEDAYFLQRLHTPNTGYSGLTQPADFLLFGRGANYIELKETEKDFFSLSSMEQLPKIKDFERDKHKASLPFAYRVIVHFIKHKKYVIVSSETVLDLVEKHKTLRPDCPFAAVFSSLKEMKENYLL